MPKYLVKTRNWNGKKWVNKLLKLTRKVGVQSYYLKAGDGYTSDEKFWLETTNPYKAWLIWAYFMALRHFSGGWTYIHRPGYKGSYEGYKAIY